MTSIRESVEEINQSQEEEIGEDELDQRPQIGTVAKSQDNIWISGTLVGSVDVPRENQYTRLPAIGVIHTEEYDDLFLCMHGEQVAGLEITPMFEFNTVNDSILSDIDSYIIEQKFVGIKLGRIEANTTEVGYTSEQIQINRTLFLATEEQIEQYLKDAPNFNWLFEIGKRSSDLLASIAPTVAEYLSSYYGFQVDQFCARVIETLIPEKIVEGHLSDIIKRIYENSGNNPPLGHVIKTDGSMVEILSQEPFNIERQPIVVAKDIGSSRNFILQSSKGKSLSTETIKHFATDADNNLTSPSSGIRIGSEVIETAKKDVEPLLEPNVLENPTIALPIGVLSGLDNYPDDPNVPDEDRTLFPVYIEPGTGSLNMGIMGVTRSGKTVLVQEMLLQGARHNIIIDQENASVNKIGGIVFDKQGEFTEKFIKVCEENPTLFQYIEFLDPANMPTARLQLKDLKLNHLMKGSSASAPETVLSLMIKWAVNEKGFDPVKFGNRQVDRLTVEMLNFFLFDMEGEDYSALKDEYGYNRGQIDAVIRQLQKLRTDATGQIVQIRYDEEEERFFEESEGDPQKNNILARLYRAQLQGKILIIDFSNLGSSTGISRVVNFLRTRILEKLNKDRSDLRMDKGEKKFRRETPIFFVVNEEATSELSGKSSSEVQEWIDSVTGAAKNLIGNIFVFQTTYRVSPVILSQLSGFSAVFRISNHNDRKTVMNGTTLANLKMFEEYIAESENGVAVMGGQVLRGKPFVVRVEHPDRFFSKADDLDYMTPWYILPEELENK